MKRIQRIVSLLVCFALMAGYMPVPANAEDLAQQGLCEHHQAHIDCSYTAAIAAVECGHQHEDACYALKCVHVHGDCGYVPAVAGVACDHQHDDNCGYTAAVAEVPCSCVPEVRNEQNHAEECTYDSAVAESVCIASPEETVSEIIHTEDCAYASAIPEGVCSHDHAACSFVEAKAEIPCGHDCTMDAACSEKVLICLHEHDEECGYAEARAAVACDFVCDECANMKMDIATVTEHRYGTVYTPYTHTNDSAKPYSLVNGIYYSTNHSRNSEASYTIVANFDTILSINYGVSSETNFDEFTLNHNGTQLFCISGNETGEETINLTRGDTLVFTYEKDDSESDGDDRGWFEITSGDNYLNEELTTPNCHGNVCCLDCGQVLYEQLPHNRVTLPAVAPTCTTEGKTAGQACSECGLVTVAQDMIPVTAHSFINGICTVCESVTYSEGITFKLSDDGTFYIVSGIGTFTGESLIIPQVYNRLPVKEIGALAFANCSKLTNVTIPSSITAIADKAFHNCTGLERVYISDLDAWCKISFDYEREWDEGLWIESYSNPLKYAHDLYLNGEKVTDIVLSDAPKAHAFYGCSLNSVTFTRQVGLNTGVFRGSSLTELSIPGGPSYLQPYSLHECRNIDGAFYLPASVTEVGDWTFWGPSIKIMYLEGSKIPDRCDDLDYGNTGPFSSSGAKVVYNCRLVQVDGNDYVIKDGEAWFIRCPQTRVGSVEILPQVTYGDQTYNVTKIGDYAFYKCDQITSITIPNSITSIGGGAFSGTSSLQRFDISDLASWCKITFTDVASNPLYYNCDMYLDGELVTNVIIPDSVTSIGQYAFYGYDKLTDVTMGGGIINIGYEAFSYCSSLQRIWFISDAPSIAGSAFDEVTATAYYPANNDTWTDTVKQGYGGAITWNPYTTVHTHEYDDNHKCSCGAIGGSCGDNLTWKLDGNGTLTISGTGPMCVYDWGGSPWRVYAEEITTVVVENGITHIGANSFCELKQLTSVFLPGGLKSIGSRAFSWCTALTTIELPEGLECIGSEAFYLNWELLSIDIPASVSSIGNDIVDQCWSLTSINVHPDNPNYCDVDGVLFNKNADTLIDFPAGRSGNYTVPESVICIGDGAFAFCQQLSEVIILEGVRTIGYTAFRHCDGLRSVNIPASVTSIGDMAFARCFSLTSIDVHEDNLNYCDLDGVLFDKEIKILIAFPGNHSEIYTIPSTVTTIGLLSFEYYDLEKVTIPASVAHIDHSAFDNFRGNLVFEGDAPNFDGNVFGGSEITVHYPENTTGWDDVVNEEFWDGTIAWVPYRPIENRIVLDGADFDGLNAVWVDGVEYAVQTAGDQRYVDLPDSNAKTLTVYTYHEGADVHSQYPTAMTVWTLSNEAGFYSANRVPELDNILNYCGMSIRVAGKKGIRMVTSIPQADKAALTTVGLAGYTLREYGTVIAWSSQLGEGNPLVLDAQYAKHNYAYKKDVADPVYRVEKGQMMYTNVLVDFNYDQCGKDIAMRSYMILADTEGNEITLYGGTVERSIGYIAYQNRAVFQPDSDAYEYIWDIIHAVYGDIYDSEYSPTWTPITP